VYLGGIEFGKSRKGTKGKNPKPKKEQTRNKSLLIILIFKKE
jgi:hypothetical protein